MILGYKIRGGRPVRRTEQEQAAVDRLKAERGIREASKPAYNRGELFARLPLRVLRIMMGVPHVASIFYCHLYIESFRRGHKPFLLRVDKLEAESGVNRWAQARALRDLEEAGLITVERFGHKRPTYITIPGVTGILDDK